MNFNSHVMALIARTAIGPRWRSTDINQDTHLLVAGG